MATYNLTANGEAIMQSQSIEFKETNAFDLNQPTFSSVTRATSPTDIFQNNFTFSNLESAVRGELQGRRPNFDMQYPRGYYNT
tara:strand:+ start:1755 stop:2003 length:249 start_codon:yes stop_codon:yes gene_type:complete